MKAGVTIHMSVPAIMLAAFISMAAATPAIYAGVQLESATAQVAAVETGGRWRVPVSIVNRGDRVAKDVQITTVSMDRANAVDSLPLKVGEIPAGGMGTVSLTFTLAGLTPPKDHTVDVKGTYVDLAGRRGFSLRFAASIFSAAVAAPAASSPAVTVDNSQHSSGVRKPAEPPGFAAANPGPGRAVPAGPGNPGPKSSETSTKPTPQSAPAKVNANPDGVDLIPVQVNGVWGYAKSHRPSDLLIRPQFTHALKFSEGLAAVAVADKWGYIDTSGAFRIPAQFQAASPFAGGVAKVRDGKRLRYIDPTGRFVPGPAR